MADLGELRIPVAMRLTAEQVIALTDKVCADLLDEEYAGRGEAQPCPMPQWLADLGRP